MQSDFFDNKVKEAADHHHPAYDEQAWKGMEKLLNKHLPQKDDNRRRFLFFILLFLLLGGGSWLLISQPWKNGNPVADTNKTNPVTTPSNESNKELKKETATINDKSPIPGDLPVDPKDVIEKANEKTPSQNKNPLTVNERRNDPLAVAIKKTIKTNKPTNSVIDAKNERTEEKTFEPNKTELVTITEAAKTIVTSEPIANNNAPLVKTTPVTENKAIKKDEIKKDEPVVATEKTAKKNKNRSTKASPFFLSISAGPDISMAGQSPLGHTRLLAGIGVGYTFKDRITIRSGFYSGRKIYSASPDQYNPPPEFWTYYPYLQSVDANCKVYEIPLTVSYDFGRSAKHKWFGSAGLSSYLMNEESYKYYYKYSPTSSTIYNKKITIQNENKHFLSVLTLSAGYKRNLSKKVFVMAEPYVKMPLVGIGYGKVKLNSGGVLFTVGVRPFNAKKPVTSNK